MSSNEATKSKDETFFTQNNVIFPELTPDGKLDTLQFITAAKGVVSLVDAFGKTFAPVKSDMNGNVEKLTKQYNKNKEAHATIQDMIIAEKNKGEDFATVALLWLKRALHFFQVFLQCVVKDAEEGKNTENVSGFLKEAYIVSLERYHGWMTQKLFTVLYGICPYRKDILLKMSLGQPGRDHLVIRDLGPFIVSLEKVVAAIDKLYLEHELDLEAKA